ncbi:MAG: RNA polymerase sigma-70 factor [Telluria sp.]
MDDLIDTFKILRPRLIAIAYRMLGSRADAEDVVQDAYLRAHGREHQEIRCGEAWLVTITTRLCVDRLRRSSVEREAYIGPWLPEPIVSRRGEPPDAMMELAAEVSMAFMVVLERLSPDERAVFLLHQVFEFDYAEIAEVMEKSVAACRQMFHRARMRVQAGQPRFRISRDEHQRLLDRFILASREGNRSVLAQLLTEDAAFTSDGGGKRRAAIKVIVGADRIARMQAGITCKWGARISYESAEINGEPGALRFLDGELDAVISIGIDSGRIEAIYMVRNPDKLRAVKVSGRLH